MAGIKLLNLHVDATINLFTKFIYGIILYKRFANYKMKRKFITIGLFIAATIGVLYLLPTKNQEQETIFVNIPLEAVIRTMSDQKKWPAWWSGKIFTDSTYELNGAAILIEKNLLNGFYGKIINGNLSSRVDLRFSAMSEMQTKFDINITHQFSGNIFTKATQYIHLLGNRKLKSRILKDLFSFFSNTKKVYGFEIKTEKIKDPAYIASKKDLDHYPSVDELYHLINQLKKYIDAKNGKIVAEPIMNIFKLNTTTYRLMAAIATDRELPSTDPFYLKNMVLGNVLVTEVIGGQQSTELGGRALEYFIDDHKKTTAAIPFQRLVTDRSSEKDSSKWITKLYYPIY